MAHQGTTQILVWWYGGHPTREILAGGSGEKLIPFLEVNWSPALVHVLKVVVSHTAINA